MKYSEGDKNLQYYFKHGRFPDVPPQYRKQLMGNEISEIVGTHYEGERTPRQIQKLPMYNYYQTQHFAPTTIEVPAAFGQNSESDIIPLFMVGGLALFLLAVFGIVSFKGL